MSISGLAFYITEVYFPPAAFLPGVGIFPFLCLSLGIYMEMCPAFHSHRILCDSSGQISPSSSLFSCYIVNGSHYSEELLNLKSLLKTIFSLQKIYTMNF